MTISAIADKVALMEALKLFLKFSIGLLLISILNVAQAAVAPARHFPPGTQQVFIADQNGIRADLLANITSLVEKSIADGYYPGAVILVSHRGNIVYKGVFGNQQITPDLVPMRFETIFDLASLTKVIVTSTAIMQLVEEGKIDLDTPVAQYWPAFADNHKQLVTVRQLLTHTSGFQASIPIWKAPSDPAQAYLSGLQQIERIGLVNSPGKMFTYSDINFITLGHLVELISGQSLAQYAQDHIFKPLNMTSATFLPAQNLQSQIAPTSSSEDQKIRWGQVNDPTAERMGGVIGAAGLFANAQDVGLFLQCLLNGGKISNQHYLLGPLTILKMSTPQTPLGMTEIRGFGWDIDSHYSNRGVLLPTSSFGHSGWTGTSVWIDPITQTWIIILTSRTHPMIAEKNQLIADRRAIANIVAGSLTDISMQNVVATGIGELQNAYIKKTASSQ